LVPGFQPSPVQGLFQILASKDAIAVRYSALLRRLSDSPRNLGGDVLIVSGLTANQASESNNGIVLASFSQCSGLRRDFERPRHSDDRDVAFVASAAPQTIPGALQKSLRDERVPTRNHNGKAHASGVELAFESHLVITIFLPEDDLHAVDRLSDK